MDEPYRPTIRSQADLEEAWHRLLGPGGFGRRSVWMIRVEPDGRLIPVITEIAECDAEPDPASAAGFAEILRALDEDDPGGSFAFLVSRPGPLRVEDDDRTWGRFLVEAGRVAGVRLEMPHLATDAGVVALPPDELTLDRSA